MSQHKFDNYNDADEKIIEYTGKINKVALQLKEKKLKIKQCSKKLKEEYERMYYINLRSSAMQDNYDPKNIWENTCSRNNMTQNCKNDYKTRKRNRYTSLHSTLFFI